jgi:hypothetical protein
MMSANRASFSLKGDLFKERAGADADADAPAWSLPPSGGETGIDAGGGDLERSKCTLFWHMLAFNMTNSFREMRKRPMNFCLGMSSVFLVVVVAAVCFTIIEKMPVIFLQRAEADEGQIDLWLRSSRRFSNPQMPYLNHTALAENVAPIPELTSHTPRFTVNSYPYTQGCTTRSTDLGFDPLDFAWKYQGFPNNEYDGCFNHTLDCVSSICSNENPFAVKDQTQIVAIDSLQEDLVGLGRSWPYAGVKIDYGSAMVGFVLAERLDLRVGDVFYARVDLPSDRNPLLGDLVNFGMDSFHNDNSSVRGKFPTSKANVLFSDVIDHYGEAIFVPIFVQGIYGTNGGKFEDNKRGDGKIIMEFEHFLPFLVEHLHPGTCYVTYVCVSVSTSICIHVKLVFFNHLLTHTHIIQCSGRRASLSWPSMGRTLAPATSTSSASTELSRTLCWVCTRNHPRLCPSI